MVPSTIGVLVFGWAQGYINMSISNASESMIPEGVPMPIQFLIMCLFVRNGVCAWEHLLTQKKQKIF